MTKTILLLVLLACSILGLPACGAGGAALEDTTWALQSYGETGNLKAVLADTEVTAEFVSAEGTVKGSAGCNSYSGGYELDKDTLALPGPLISTMMACPEPIMNQELEYLATLQAAESYSIDGDQLQITSGDKVLIFKPK